MNFRQRETDHSLPLLERLYVGRGEAREAARGAPSLADLLPFSAMKGIDDAARIISEAIIAKQHLVLCGDFDADGAGSCTVAVAGLRLMGAQRVRYVVPDRMIHGYGLSPVLADLIAEDGCDVLITVDNGIAAHAGVLRARSHNMTVVVTDHHGCPDQLPDADAIVNPVQPGCAFQSKALSGCGVIFYVLLAVRTMLRSKGYFDRPDTPECPNLALLLDLVALSTVGDLVPLDQNNRILVSHGLKLMRAGRACPGIQGLFTASSLDIEFASAANLGYALAPRVNAAGRIDNMRAGIDCLLEDDPTQALARARFLDSVNRQRRAMQAKMSEQAMEITARFDTVPNGAVLFQHDWHQGVIGLVATRVKDQLHRPTFAFADAGDGKLKGSGRSIPGVHLRDALAEIQAMPDSPLLHMGGHAMACGCAVKAEHLDRFKALFDEACRRRLSPAQLERVTLTDGALAPDEISVATARDIEWAGPWGQGFDEPLFEGEFKIEEVRTMGSDGQHARYEARVGNKAFAMVHFNAGDSMAFPGAMLGATYRLNMNRWNGRESLQLIVDQVRL